MTDVAPCGCLAAKLDSCNSLLSSVHTLLVNILRCVRLYIKRKYYSIIIYKQKFPNDLFYFCFSLNYHLQLHSGQLSLYIFTNHHFRTYFVYNISCNNISRPVHDPSPKSGGMTPKLPRLTSIVGRDGALVESITFNWRVVGSTPSLAVT